MHVPSAPLTNPFSHSQPILHIVGQIWGGFCPHFGSQAVPQVVKTSLGPHCFSSKKLLGLSPEWRKRTLITIWSWISYKIVIIRFKAEFSRLYVLNSNNKLPEQSSTHVPSSFLRKPRRQKHPWMHCMVQSWGLGVLQEGSQLLPHMLYSSFGPHVDLAVAVRWGRIQLNYRNSLTHMKL